MKILGLTGKMGSGKSTALNQLNELLHGQIVVIKFAEPLYLMQELIYSMIETVYTRPPDFIKDRKLLQFIGTEWGRNTISPTLWLDLWADRVKHTASVYPNALIVVDDVRFNNEAESIRYLGGHIIRLESNKISERSVSGAELTGHSSENGVDIEYIDYVVENNGTLDDLRTSLLTVNDKLAIW
jgi:energy-coupling factor transporter ATP-binding protein EcfA2